MRLSRQARTAIAGSITVAQTGAAVAAVLACTVRDGGGNVVSGKVVQLIIAVNPGGTTCAMTAGFTGNAIEVGATHTLGFGVTNASGVASFTTTGLGVADVVYAICGGVAQRYAVVA